MKVLHVSVETEEGWLIAQGLEEPAVITQAKTLDELLANVREVVTLLDGEKDLQVELILPPTVQRTSKRAIRSRRKAG